MLPDPKWLATQKTFPSILARQRFWLRIAALYLTETGTVTDLSVLLGRTTAALLNYSTKRCTPIPAELAIQIESLVGRDVIPRERFRPDLFTLPPETEKR